MAVKIRLKRMGKIRSPFYRVVVMDSRTKRDGRAIEEIGKYHPTEEPSLIEIDSERAQHWLSNGAQPTEAALALLKVTGDWQKFNGTEGAEGTLKVKAPKKSKKELYEAAIAAAGGSSLDVKDPTPRKKAPAKKAAEPRSSATATSQDAAATIEPSSQAAEPTPQQTTEASSQPAVEPTPQETTEAAAEATPVASDTDSGAASASSVDTADSPEDTSSSAADAEKSEA